MTTASERLSAWYLSDEPGAILAAAAALPELSSGRVRLPETIHRRTGKPEREGLFCARTFGPVEDLRCLCGKLEGQAHEGQTCDRCGVLCSASNLRAERWGHVESPEPLVHPRLVPRIAAALGLPAKAVISVFRFEASLRPDGRVVREEVEGGRGADALARALGPEAERLLLRLVPVTPPAWRGTRRDPQDEALAGLVNRTNRLRRLLELNAPQIILDNELRMTQDALERVHAAIRAELQARRPVVVAPRSRTGDALLQAVYDAPDDDAPRRAYAEHLRDAGDLRGDFILRQLASAWASRTPKLEADMLRRNLERWLGSLADAVELGVSFRRGFLSACTTLPAAAEKLDDPAWATVERLRSDHVELITRPHLLALRGLTLSSRTLQALCARDAAMPRMIELTADVPRCPPPGLERLTRGELFPGLKTLTLRIRSTAVADDSAWLDEAPLSAGLGRLTLVLSGERVDSLGLPGWTSFVQRHPQVAVSLDVGPRLVRVEIGCEAGLPSVTVHVTRAWIERVMLGGAEVSEPLGASLTALDPYGLASLRIRSPHAWWGEDLEALARSLREYFGGGIELPRLT